MPRNKPLDSKDGLTRRGKEAKQDSDDKEQPIPALEVDDVEPIKLLSFLDRIP